MPSSRESRLSPAQGSFITLLPKPNFIQKLFNSVLLGHPFTPWGSLMKEKGKHCAFPRGQTVSLTSSRLLQIWIWRSQET